MLFRSLILDVDSTLCGVEGIDFLAARRGPELGAQVARVTQRTMEGEVPLEAVYGERLALIRPTRADIAALADMYAATLAPGASDVIARLRAVGVTIVLVSGGIRQAIEPATNALGLPDEALNAVRLRFEADGTYSGFDAESPLTTQQGKQRIVAALALPRPILAVGDGSTDVAMKHAADAFAAFVGFARRENVVAEADYVVSTFEEIEALVRGV
jgi:phosphoserine phosphatase